jgi:hypothetical protein
MIAYALTALAAVAAQATMDHNQMDHAAMPAAQASSTVVPEPHEPGQSAYAALGEAVRILLADPATDWSKVDVDRLRQHLVDMDAVTLRSSVTTTRLPNGARFVVTGTPDVAAGIKRMVGSHFAQPDVGNGWTFNATPRDDGAVITVTSANPAQAARIAGLGFYGILTMGEHHQPHHLMMARGAMKH